MLRSRGNTKERNSEPGNGAVDLLYNRDYECTFILHKESAGDDNLSLLADTRSLSPLPRFPASDSKDGAGEILFGLALEMSDTSDIILS